MRLQGTPDGSGAAVLEIVQEDAAPALRIRHEGSSGNALEILGPNGQVLWSVDAGGSPYGPGQPRVSLQRFGIKFDGTDESAKVNTAFASLSAAGGGIPYVPAGKTLGLGGPVTLLQDVWLHASSATIKWVGGSNGTMFTQATAAGPTIRTGVLGVDGHAVIDPNGATGLTVFDLHSPQFNRYEGLDILAAGDQTGTTFKIACDVTSNGGYGSNRNAVYNSIRQIAAGKAGTFLSMVGAAVASQVITLNTFEHINALNQGVGFISIGAYCDNNTFLGTMRCSLNQNNAVGVDFAADATCYANIFHVLQVDTFAGKTGRIGVRFGALGSRNLIGYYFNNPAAEGGQVVASGDSWDILAGDWVESGVASSGISSTHRRKTEVSSFRTLTYSASMTPDATLLNTDGTYKVTVTDTVASAMNAPAGPSTGQRMTFDILNSSGSAMGAITWNAVFKLAGAFTNPATTKRRTIEFYYDGTSWVERNRAAADI